MRRVVKVHNKPLPEVHSKDWLAAEVYGQTGLFSDDARVGPSRERQCEQGLELGSCTVQVGFLLSPACVILT